MIRYGMIRYDMIYGIRQFYNEGFNEMTHKLHQVLSRFLYVYITFYLYLFALV